MLKVVKRLIPLTALSCVLMVGGVMPQLPFSAKGIAGVERAVAAVSQFDQNQGYDRLTMETFGGGYQKGAYDLNAAQPAPTGANWNGRSRFTGVSQLTDEQEVSQWSFQTGGAINTYSSPVVAADGTIYVASTDAKLYALTPSGKRKWVFATSTGSFQASPAIGADGTIYVGSTNNKVYAVNPDGTQKWEYSTGGSVNNSPAIGANGTIYIGSDDKSLHAINSDGTRKYVFTTGGVIYASPAIAPDGTALIGSHNGYLYAVNPNGTQKWVYNLGGLVYSSAAIGADGTIYVGNYHYNGIGNYSKFVALNPNGTVKWTYSVGSYITGSPAVEPDGSVYFGSHNNYLYALKPDGTVKWSYNAGQRIHGSPLIGADGTIYVASFNGSLHAVSATGAKKWTFGMEGNTYGSPAMGPDGTLYIGNSNAHLYAIGTHHFAPTQDDYSDQQMYVQADSGTIAVIAFDNNYPSDIVDYGINAGNMLRWQVSTNGINFSNVPVSFVNGKPNYARLDNLDAIKGYQVRTIYKNDEGREMVYQRVILRPDKYTGKRLPTATDFKAPYGQDPYETPVLGNEFLASTGFSDTQGKNNWYYQEWNGTSYVNMTWDSTNNWWQGSNVWTLIGSHWHHADRDTARKFVAPKAGTIKITGKVAKSSTGGGNGVNVKVMQNGTQLWPASGWQHIEFDDAVG